MDKVTRKCPQRQSFWRERRAEAVSNPGPSAYQSNALPLGQTGSRKDPVAHVRSFVQEIVDLPSPTNQSQQDGLCDKSKQSHGSSMHKTVTKVWCGSLERTRYPAENTWAFYQGPALPIMMELPDGHLAVQTWKSMSLFHTKLDLPAMPQRTERPSRSVDCPPPPPPPTLLYLFKNKNKNLRTTWRWNDEKGSLVKFSPPARWNFNQGLGQW